jgi:hypothetical protein
MKFILKNSRFGAEIGSICTIISKIDNEHYLVEVENSTFPLIINSSELGEPYGIPRVCPTMER